MAVDPWYVVTAAGMAGQAVSGPVDGQDGTEALALADAFIDHRPMSSKRGYDYAVCRCNGVEYETYDWAVHAATKTFDGEYLAQCDSARDAATVARVLGDAAKAIRLGLDTSNHIGQGVECACKQLDDLAARAAASAGEQRE